MITRFSTPDFYSMLDSLEIQLKIFINSKEYQAILEYQKNNADFWDDLNYLLDGIEEARDVYKEVYKHRLEADAQHTH